MPELKKTIGICEFCGGAIPREKWYTTKGKPRRFCSVVCKNTFLSRNHAAPVNSKRMRAQVADGTWKNPALLNPPGPKEQARRARIGRLREVAAGTWRNPGLTPEAREINSRPSKHSGPLAEAIESLRKTGKMASLTPAQADAYRAYRRQLHRKKRAKK